MSIYDVFLSYRRSDGLPIAQNLYRYLTSKGLRVFFDMQQMVDGHYFTTQIESALRKTPNYILIASNDVFAFRQGEDWVRAEIQIAIEEYEKNPLERTLTVIQPEEAVFPEKDKLEPSFQNIADVQRIILQYGENNAPAFRRALKAVTTINRSNLWHASHRWYENSLLPGGRFAGLDINKNIMPKTLFEAFGSAHKHLYLIGQGGIGKTTALMHIMNTAYKNSSYSEQAQIPLFVELSFAPDTYGTLYEQGKSSFIRRSIYKQVRTDRTIKQITAQAVEEIDEVFMLPREMVVAPINDILSKQTPAPEYLLLLDGLNEVSPSIIEETGLSVQQMITKEIETLITKCPNIRVILTSRSDDSSIYHDSIERFYLSGIDEENIWIFLKEKNIPKEQISLICSNQNLLDTLKIPLFLFMYTSLSDTKGVTSQGEILRMFFHERRENLGIYTVQNRIAKIEQDISHSSSASQKKRLDADMQNFILDFLLPEIAWEMKQNEEFYLRTRNIKKIIEPVLTDTSDTAICGDFGRELFSKYRKKGAANMHTYKTAKKILERLGDDMTEITENIINCLIFSLGILQETNSRYGFVHQHIRDYFAAVKNIHSLRLAVYLFENEEKDLALSCLKSFGQRPLPVTIRRFVGEYLGEHHNAPYYQNDQWNYAVPSEPCDRNLIQRVLLIYKGNFDLKNDYGIYSLIEILKEVRKDLSGEDFSHLDLHLCTFHNTRMGNPHFGATLEGSLLTPDNLFQSGPNVGMMNAISQKADLSPDGKHLMLFYSHMLKLWNTDIMLYEKEFKDDASFILHACFSADGRYLAILTAQGKIFFYKTADFSLTFLLEDFSDSPYKMEYIPGTDLALIFLENNLVELWKITSTSSEKLISQNFHTPRVLYDPTRNRFLALNESGHIDIYDKNGVYIKTQRCHNKEEAVLCNFFFTTDYKSIIWYDSTSIQLFHGETFCMEKSIDGLEIHIEKDDKIHCLAHDDRFIYLQSWEGIQYLSLQTFEIVDEFSSQIFGCPLEILAKEKTYLVSTQREKNVMLWDLHRKELIGTIPSSTHSLDDMKYSGDGSGILISMDGFLHLYEPVKNKFTKMAPISGYEFTKISAHPSDCRSLVQSGKALDIVDTRTFLGTDTYHEETGYYNSAIYHPNGRDIIAVYDQSPVIDILDAHTFAKKQRFTMEGAGYISHAIAAPISGKLIIFAYQSPAMIFDPATGQTEKTDSIGYGDTYFLLEPFVLSCDEKYQAVLTKDMHFVVTNNITQKSRRFLPPWEPSRIDFFGFTPGTNYFIVQVYKELCVYDADTLNCISKFCLDNGSSIFHKIAYAPDGIHLAFALYNNEIYIYNILTGELSQPGHFTSGLYVNNVNLKIRGWENAFTDEQKEILQQFGAKIEDRNW